MRKQHGKDSSEEEDDDENHFPTVSYHKSAVLAAKGVETKVAIVED
jgi:hypothetical protein